jgi:hypothetical protein
MTLAQNCKQIQPLCLEPMSLALKVRRSAPGALALHSFCCARNSNANRLILNSHLWTMELNTMSLGARYGLTILQTVGAGPRDRYWR